MRLYGIIGYPLTHSFSKKYFTEKFKQEGLKNRAYDNFPLENIAELPALINSLKELEGLSVTIPHKQSVISYLTGISDEAKEIGAVNVIKITRSANSDQPLLTGYNTDVFGFEQSLKPILKSHHRKALILGTGGASKAVAYVLNKLDIEFLFASRKKIGNKTVNYSELNEEVITDRPLIINSTPLGTYPGVEGFPPIPYEFITENHLLFDLVYNPGETVFLQKGKARGATVQNGLTMLTLQAEKAWEIWQAK